jgi:rhodanese-related sulfurtransferase
MLEVAAAEAREFFEYSLSQRKTVESLFLDLNDRKIVFTSLPSDAERILDKEKSTCVYCDSPFRVGDAIRKINDSEPKHHCIFFKSPLHHH